MNQEPERLVHQKPEPVWIFEPLHESDLDQSVPERFQQQVARYPDRLAAQGERYRFTYRQLNAAANRFARAILDRRGPGEEVICLLLEHDALAVAAMIGVLKAGKIYVALDPAVPRDRLDYFYTDSTSELIVTSAAHEPLARELMPPGQDPLNLDRLDPSLAQSDLHLPLSPDTLAYIYYTSGSSGRPKGVYNSQRNLLHRVLRNTNFFEITPGDRLSCVRSLSFSGSIKDVWGAVLKGASVHLFDLRAQGFARMASWLDEQEITLYVSVATSFRQLAAAVEAGRAPRYLRTIHIGGEPVRWSDLDLHERLFPPTCRLAIGMGITETGNFTRQYVDETTRLEGEDVPAGYPLHGMEILILDGAGQALDPGQAGQIAVRSKYLTLGYWHQPELTRQRFLPDPAGGPARIYLTGDLGYLRPDGCLVCLGRADDQVKVAGHRVELSEIEQALLAHPQVAEAAVVAHPSPTGDTLLAAYFVSSGQAPAPSELRRFLAARLTAAVVPTRFIPLDEMPLTRSGKVDRRSLPAPAHIRPELESAYVEPRYPLEETVARIWRETLELDRIGIHDNFFDLGGHSLLAARIIARMREALRVDLSFETLFNAPTVAGLAAALTGEQRAAAEAGELEQLVADLEAMPDDRVEQALRGEGAQGLSF